MNTTRQNQILNDLDACRAKIAKHTPGPWRTERCHMGQWIKAGGSFIAPLPDHIEHEGQSCGSIASQDKTQDEIDANARLIAAAPELLDHLEMLVFVIENRVDVPTEGAALKAARAAIAKTKGGES